MFKAKGHRHHFLGYSMRNFIQENFSKIEIQIWSNASRRRAWTTFQTFISISREQILSKWSIAAYIQLYLTSCYLANLWWQHMSPTEKVVEIILIILRQKRCNMSLVTALQTHFNCFGTFGWYFFSIQMSESGKFRSLWYTLKFLHETHVFRAIISIALKKVPIIKN